MAEPTEGPAGTAGDSGAAKKLSSVEQAMQVLDEMAAFTGVLRGMVQQVMAAGFTQAQAAEIVTGLIKQSIHEQTKKR